MKSVYVKFNDKEEIINFVNIISQFDFDFDLVKGRKIVDAKSYLGILCFDLVSPIRLDIHCDNEENNQKVIEALSTLVVNE